MDDKKTKPNLPKPLVLAVMNARGYAPMKIDWHGVRLAAMRRSRDMVIHDQIKEQYGEKEKT